MDRRLFEAVRLNAKRMGEARSRKASEAEVESIRDAGRAELEAIRSLIEAGEPDDGHPEELRTWQEQERRRDAPNLAADWFWSRIPN